MHSSTFAVFSFCFFFLGNGGVGDIWSKNRTLHWFKQTMPRLIMSNQRGTKLSKLHLSRNAVKENLLPKQEREREAVTGLSLISECIIAEVNPFEPEFMATNREAPWSFVQRKSIWAQVIGAKDAFTEEILHPSWLLFRPDTLRCHRISSRHEVIAAQCPHMGKEMCGW